MPSTEPLQLLLGIAMTLKQEGASNRYIETILGGTKLPEKLVHAAGMASGIYDPLAASGPYSRYHTRPRYQQ